MRTLIARSSPASPAPLLVALLLPLGCGGAPSPTPALAPPARPPAAISKPAPPASPASVASTEVQPPDPPSPFSPVIVHGPRSLRFFPLKRFGVAVSEQWDPIPVRVDERGARIDTGLFAGVREGLEEDPVETPVFAVNYIGGDLPAQGSLDVTIPGDRGGGGVSFTWKGARWQRLPQGDLPLDAPMEVNQAYYAGGILSQTPWESRVLYEIMDTTGDPAKPRLVAGGKGQSPPLPRITPGDGSCPTKLLAHADLAALPSGELLGFGKVCTGGASLSHGVQTGEGPLAVERWRRGSRDATIEILPGSEGRESLGPWSRFVVHGPNDVHLVANLTAADGERERAYLAHYDGQSWTREPIEVQGSIGRVYRTPDGATWVELDTEVRRRKKGGAWEALVPPGPRAPLRGIERAPDGTLWARHGDALLHLGADDRWEKVPLPRLDGRIPVPESVDWLGPADMVVVALNPDRQETYLLRTGAPGSVLDYEAAVTALRDRQDAGESEPAAAAPTAQEPPASGRVTPGTPACQELFVVLYKLSKVAPPDYDFPLTRAALKGHTELEGLEFAETQDGGRRYFVAFAPSFDKARKLAEVVRKGVKGSTPQVLCGRPPQVNRALRIDLRTGALVKQGSP